MKAAGMEVRNIFWLRMGTPCSLSCMSRTSCSSYRPEGHLAVSIGDIYELNLFTLSKTAGLWEMPLLMLDEAHAPPPATPDDVL